MLIHGLLLLAGACVVGVTGILDNRGAGHQVAGGFDAFGRTMHGSSGQLFFWGIVVGGVATVGLLLLLAGLRRDVRRRRAARRGTSAQAKLDQQARLDERAASAPAASAAADPVENGRTVSEPTAASVDDEESVNTDEPAHTRQ